MADLPTIRLSIIQALLYNMGGVPNVCEVVAAAAELEHYVTTGFYDGRATTEACHATGKFACKDLGPYHTPLSFPARELFP